MFLKGSKVENLLEDFLNLRELYLDLVSELNNDNIIRRELGLYSLRYVIEEMYLKLTVEKLEDLKESCEELRKKIKK